MKKIITILLAVLLILSMAIPAMAVTPPLQAPDIPEIPDISDSVQKNLEEQYDFDYAVDAYLNEHPIVITPTEAPTEERTEEPTEETTEAPTEKPTEPPAEEEPTTPDWCGWQAWFRQWWDKIVSFGGMFRDC